MLQFDDELLENAQGQLKMLEIKYAEPKKIKKKKLQPQAPI